MKKFENPTLEVEKLEIMDVITTSVQEDDNINCGNDLGL